jgi:error-prone DNA polymerase
MNLKERAKPSAVQEKQATRTPGMAIARQRPGSASELIFLSLEDETGISNAIIRPDLFEKNRLVITRSKVLLIEGQLQNLDGTLSINAASVKPLNLTA